MGFLDRMVSDLIYKNTGIRFGLFGKIKNNLPVCNSICDFIGKFF